jgi:protein-arginine kinase activator protein McsA
MARLTLCVLIVSCALAPAADAFCTSLRPPQHTAQRRALHRALRPVPALSDAGACPHARATPTARAMQDPLRRSSETASPDGVWPLLHGAAFDAASIDDTLWLALLAVLWPLLVAWSMVLATARTLGGVLAVVQQVHGPQSVPTVYLPPMQVLSRGAASRASARSFTASSAPTVSQSSSSSSSSRTGDMDWALLSAQVRLQTAISNEDYAAARAIKAEIDASQRRLTNLLAHQLQTSCTKMRQREEEERGKTRDQPVDVSRLQALIAAAVADEDFATAANLQKQLQRLPSSGALAPIAAHRADLTFLEWDVKRRANEMFIEYAAQRRDPIANLTATLDELIQDENFEDAAEVHAELLELQRERDRRDLLKMLRDDIIKQRIMQVVREQNNAEWVRREIERSQKTLGEARDPAGDGAGSRSSTGGGAHPATWADFFEIKTWENP